MEGYTGAYVHGPGDFASFYPADILSFNLMPNICFDDERVKGWISQLYNGHYCLHNIVIYCEPIKNALLFPINKLPDFILLKIFKHVIDECPYFLPYIALTNKIWYSIFKNNEVYFHQKISKIVNSKKPQLLNSNCVVPDRYLFASRKNMDDQGFKHVKYLDPDKFEGKPYYIVFSYGVRYVKPNARGIKITMNHGRLERTGGSNCYSASGTYITSSPQLRYSLAYQKRKKYINAREQKTYTRNQRKYSYRGHTGRRTRFR